MKTNKSQVVKLLGIIIIVCAISIVILNYFLNKSADDYIYPFILLFTGITILGNKSRKAEYKPDYKTRKGIIIYTLLAFIVTTGIITMFITLF